MSYRTYIEDTQVLGNNEQYPEWIEFLKQEGIDVSESGEYDGYITNVMGMIITLECIVLRLERERREKRQKVIDKLIEKNTPLSEVKETLNRMYGISSLFNFESVFDDIEHEDKTCRFHTTLTDKLIEYSQNAYMFMPYAAIRACEAKIERDEPFSTFGHFYCYKIKPDEKIHVKAN